MAAVLQGTGQPVRAGTLRKPEGSVSRQCSPQRCQGTSRSRRGQERGRSRTRTTHGRNSVRAAELPHGLTGMTEGTAAASAAGTGLQTGWEALRGSYSQFPPSFHTLSECFPPKKSGDPGSRELCFPICMCTCFGIGGSF